MKLLTSTPRLIREIYEDRRLLIDLSAKDMQRRFSGTYFGLLWGFCSCVFSCYSEHLFLF